MKTAKILVYHQEPQELAEGTFAIKGMPDFGALQNERKILVRDVDTLRQALDAINIAPKQREAAISGAEAGTEVSIETTMEKWDHLQHWACPHDDQKSNGHASE